MTKKGVKIPKCIYRNVSVKKHEMIILVKSPAERLEDLYM